MPEQLISPATNWEELFEQRKIVWHYPGHGPHAIYSLSDKHSNFYFNSDYMVANGALVKELCQSLFEDVVNSHELKPDWVVTYPPFGLNIGYCLAELFDSKLAYIKSLAEAEIQFDVRPGETALFCADDLYSGKSFRKVLKALKARGAKLIEPLMVIGNFAGKANFDGYTVESLFAREIELWDKADCPLCKLGSTPVLARRHWDELTSIV
jgi:orotate phosphoribosyltransferase